MFLLDSSDESKQKFPAIINFVQRIVRSLNIDANGDHVAVVQYSNSAMINFKLSHNMTQNDVLETIKGLTHKGGYPQNIGTALQYVKEHIFTPESGSRLQEGVPQILILLNGRRSGDDIKTPVRMLRENGVISIVIGTTDADILELQTISQEPKYALSITDYDELPNVQQDVLSLLRQASHNAMHTGATAGFGEMDFFLTFFETFSFYYREGGNGDYHCYRLAVIFRKSHCYDFFLNFCSRF